MINHAAPTEHWSEIGFHQQKLSKPTRSRPTEIESVHPGLGPNVERERRANDSD
jgi:hypothetical protein